LIDILKNMIPAHGVKAIFLCVVLAPLPMVQADTVLSETSVTEISGSETGDEFAPIQMLTGEAIPKSVLKVPRSRFAKTGHVIIGRGTG
jgi:hypothetical protein